MGERPQPYRDRVDAGRRLADALTPLSRLSRLTPGTVSPDVVVLGLPRGGVPVAAQVAAALGAPLDVLLVRKLGLPAHPELAMGAIGEGGTLVVNESVLRAAGVGRAQLAAVEARERAELERRAERMRRLRPRVPLTGRFALIVDDGLATGATARAACRVARRLGAVRVVVTAPVAAPAAVALLRGVADEVVCPLTPADFAAVGHWYLDFRPTTDDEVERLLAGDDPVR